MYGKKIVLFSNVNQDYFGKKEYEKNHNQLKLHKAQYLVIVQNGQESFLFLCFT